MLFDRPNLPRVPINVPGSYFGELELHEGKFIACELTEVTAILPVPVRVEMTVYMEDRQDKPVLLEYDINEYYEAEIQDNPALTPEYDEVDCLRDMLSRCVRMGDFSEFGIKSIGDDIVEARRKQQ